MIIRAALGALLLGLVAGLLARGAMTLVALDMFHVPAFTLGGTGGILLLYAVSAVGAALVRSLVSARVPVILGVLLTSGLLWYGALAIGLSEVGFAYDEPMTPLRWAVLWALFVLIVGLTLLTPWLGLRLGRRAHEARAIMAQRS